MNDCSNRICSNDSSQPFPTKGLLSKKLNKSLLYLKDILSNEITSDVYCYVISTIKRQENNFIQKGCGPNFQGDMISLCTCKHRMRTSMSVEEWGGKWIAGFTGIKAGGGKNALVYLMKVGYSFKSHRDLWYSKDTLGKNAKSASKSIFGDFYRPKNKSIDPFDYSDYKPPLLKHKHHIDEEDDKWHDDIYYDRGFGNHVAALLIGDPFLSFLWSKPQIYFHDQLHRGQKKIEIKKMIKLLSE